MRKMNEPVWVEPAPLYAVPSPVPVLVPEGVAGVAEAAPLRIGSAGLPVTVENTPYPDRGIRYMPSFYGSYFGRVHVVPLALYLTNPGEGEPNSFYLWNTSFQTATLAAITEQNTEGLTLDFGPGIQISTFDLFLAAVSADRDALDGQVSSYSFDFGLSGVAPLLVTIIRTNLLAVSPEQPLAHSLAWMTDVMQARDGTEQRSSLRQLSRQTFELKMVMPDEDNENLIYRQMFSNGETMFSFPMWHAPYRLLRPAVAGDTVLSVDLEQYDIQVSDQLFLALSEEEYEIVRVQNVSPITNTINLFATLKNDFGEGQRFYRVLNGALSQPPSISYGAWNSVTANVRLLVTDTRDLFAGTTLAEELDAETFITDRVSGSTVYTLNSVPVLNARPILRNTTADAEFNWRYDTLDFQTGVIEQTTAKSNASVSYNRTFHLRYTYQHHVYNYLMNHLHGQRRPVWLPTWHNDLGASVLSASGTLIVLEGTTYGPSFPDDSSHRALWIRTNKGWLARRVINIAQTLAGNTALTVEPELPLAGIGGGPYFVSHLVLARLGTDEVQFEHRSSMSFLTTTFTSTLSTSTGA